MYQKAKNSLHKHEFLALNMYLSHFSKNLMLKYMYIVNCYPWNILHLTMLGVCLSKHKVNIIYSKLFLRYVKDIFSIIKFLYLSIFLVFLKNMFLYWYLFLNFRKQLFNLDNKRISKRKFLSSICLFKFISMYLSLYFCIYLSIPESICLFMYLFMIWCTETCRRQGYVESFWRYFFNNFLYLSFFLVFLKNMFLYWYLAKC